jgi:Zn2+/Cd2+-exporting ATPase
MKKLQYKIFGLDCVEEANLIRRELAGLINESQLAFDFLQGKLVMSLDELPDESMLETIHKRLNNTGMQYVDWDEFEKKKSTSELVDSKKKRMKLTLLSGFFILLAFSVHANTHGLMDAAIADHTGMKEYPVITILAYLAAIISGGWFIFPKAFSAIQHKRADMNLLMVIAVVGAAIIQQWFEAATVTFLFSLALLLESWSIDSARNAIQKLMTLTPDMAHTYDSKRNIIEIAVKDIAIGTTLVVKPGEKIPLDGMVTSGNPAINQASITGESMPVEKKIDDEVFAGTLNGDQSFELKTTQLAGNTALARIIQLVEEAQYRRARSEQWVTRFATYYTPCMMFLSLLVALGFPVFLGYSWAYSVYQALVLLVIACPCALVISTPVSIVAGLTCAAKNGVLIKGGSFLEIPAQLKAIALDKTGTLTRGKPMIQEIIALNGHSENEVLAIAAALEIHSTHPLAQAVCREANACGIEYVAAEKFSVIQGKGAEGVVSVGCSSTSVEVLKNTSESYWLGSHRFLHEKMPEQETDALHQQVLALEKQGRTIITLGNSKHICGLISVADGLRPETPTTLKRLKALGIQCIMMLTGDNQGTAEAIASECALDGFQAECFPADKLKVIEALIEKYGYTAMVGDGVNDAPALAASSLGIAMGAMGSDTAIETADIALMADDLSKLPWLIQHSRRTLFIIKENITFSLLVKMVFIGLALTGLATLWMAVAADMGASLLVIFNSLRLLRCKELNFI